MAHCAAFARTRIRTDGERKMSVMHGGDLTDAEAAHGSPACDWLDLSTGINPRAYPRTDLAPESLRRLPQEKSKMALLDAARTYYRVRGSHQIIAGPGSQALLQILARIARYKSTVAVVSPTYQEHAWQWAAAGHSIVEVDAIEAAVVRHADVLIVGNPNNPDGRYTDPRLLTATSAERATAGQLTVVDEAFADLTPALSVVPNLPPRTIVLRSFGKFFGLGGIRLGFAIARPDCLQEIEQRMGPWAVSGPALELGARALQDTTWINGTRAWLTERSEQLCNLLVQASFSIVGSTALFVLAAKADAGAVHDHLARAGIWVRRFEGQPTWLRFGLPGSEANVDRLRRALATMPRN